jgi:two-component system, NarL family, sensor histidine kinase YdfH
MHLPLVQSSLSTWTVCPGGQFIYLATSIQTTLPHCHCAFGKMDTVPSYTVRSDNGAKLLLRYNPIAMKTQKESLFRVEQDYRIFFIFMTVVLIGVYFMSLAQNPALHQFWNWALFTGLMVIHIVLHWMVIRIIQTPKGKVLYILGQGLLAFVITYISQNTGMVFSLYMALIGETIGFLGISRWGVLSTFYFLALSLLNFVLFTDIDNAIYWLITIIPIVIFIGMYVTMYLRQAEAREKAQALADELESANRQLTEYAARVEDLTIATERQRMARELHDTLSQGLAGLILQLEAADAHLTNNHNAKAQSIISNAMEQARSTLAEARLAIDDLRRSSSDDLDSALRLEISRFTNATGIPIFFHSDPTPPIPTPVKETLIRAVAEALTNVANHAQAHNVTVNVRMNDKNLLLTIQDDGQGFDASSIPSGHYGILGIKERVRLVNGNVEIQSKNDKGTTIRIEIPL